jgi:hypothetical protein
MWSRESGLSDEQLVGFTYTHERSSYDNATHGKRGDGGDLVLVDNVATSYGEIILGKIRIPAIQDGYIHVRYVEPAYYLRSIFLWAQYRIHYISVFMPSMSLIAIAGRERCRFPLFVHR